MRKCYDVILLVTLFLLCHKLFSLVKRFHESHSFEIDILSPQVAQTTELGTKVVELVINFTQWMKGMQFFFIAEILVAYGKIYFEV